MEGNVTIFLIKNGKEEKITSSYPGNLMGDIIILFSLEVKWFAFIQDTTISLKLFTLADNAVNTQKVVDWTMI